MVAVVSELMDKYLTDVADDAVEQNIVDFSVAFTLMAARSPERSALVRLIMAEAPHFPELLGPQMRPRGITAMIVKRLVVLNARGLLEVPEPEEAANHLFALTMGQVNNRSFYGTRTLTDAEITRMATSGARAFLRAYRPR
jgi:TetR/AcrR family transcriptional regulator, mexJK operon transcriptional repressor